MKIWLVQRAEPTPHDDQGSQRLMRVGNLGKMMAARGHSVVWWTSTFDHNGGRQRFAQDVRLPVGPGFEIEYVRAPGYKRKRSLARLFADSRLAQRFAVRVREASERPDLILASLPDPRMARDAVSFGRESRVPVVVDVRDFWPDVIYQHVPSVLRPAGRVVLAPMARATRLALAEADAITGVTESYVTWALERGGRQRTECDRAFPLAWVPSTVAASELSEAESFWDGLGVRRTPHKLMVVFVGVIGHWANFDPVLLAAKILRQRNLSVQFVICGDGDARADLLAKARDTPELVLPGWIGKGRMLALLQRADIGLAAWVDHPNFRGNIGNKVAEYVSAGLPIALSLDRGVLRELLMARGCGFSYGGRGESLADALAEMLLQPATLDTYKFRANATFREMFDGNVIYNDMITHLEEVYASHRAFPHGRSS